MDTTELNQFKKRLFQMLPEEGLSGVIQELKISIPESKEKYQTLVQIELRLQTINTDRIRGVLSQSDLELGYNRLSANLIEFINSLVPEDFIPESTTTSVPKNKTGYILYKIPSKMVVGNEKKCIVRLSFEEATIIQNIDIVSATIKPIRVSEVMEVDLIDPSEQDAFAIRYLHSKEQFIEKGDYTEWVFYIKPLREGQFPLVLKVSIIEIINNKERKKDLVLEENVIVTSESMELSTEDLPYKYMNYELNGDSRTSNRIAGAKPLLVAVMFVLFTVGAWAFDLRQEIFWMQAKIEDKVEKYKEYLNKYKEGRHKDEALRIIQENDWKETLILNTKDAYDHFLAIYPNGYFANVAKHKIDSILQSQLVIIESNSGSGVKDQTQPVKINSPNGVNDHPDIETPSSIPAESTSIEPPPIPSPKEIRMIDWLSDSTDYDSANKLTETDKAEVNKKLMKMLWDIKENLMVKINGGTLLLGDRMGDDNIGRFKRETHKKRKFTLKGGIVKDSIITEISYDWDKIKIPDFFLSKTEITQYQWLLVMDNNPSKFKCEKCPVENVSWYDAKEFIRRINGLAKVVGVKVEFRLPSETEWEYAAKGKNQNSRFGNGRRMANIYEMSFDCSQQTQVSIASDKVPLRPQQVGKFTPNDYTLWDMSGNVKEWCEDCYFIDYQGIPDNGIPKIGSCNEVVIRGGSWRSSAGNCRAASRDFAPKTLKSDEIGFRIVMNYTKVPGSKK